MLASEIAIRNGISDEGLADFYAWHLTEHIPERVGISGFLRGRRFRAADDKTHPEFITCTKPRPSRSHKVLHRIWPDSVGDNQHYANSGRVQSAPPP